jgi:TPP-dependent pyruvate/acetoin dehydrogenase alpha subunit
MQHLGRAGNLTRGRDGTGHYADPSLKIYGNISHLGAMIPVACGAALASTMRGEKAVALTYIGDGGSSIGEVHEGLMMASAMKLPFVLIIENNQFAYSTPLAKQTLAARLSDRAIGYGIPGVTIDGTDVLEVYRACREAYARARSGAGPTIIESVTMRMSGHAAHDNAWYVPKALLDAGKKKDPIDRFERLLLDEKVLTDAKKKAIRAEIDSSLELEANHALALPYPPGPEAAEGVFAGA